MVRGSGIGSHSESTLRLCRPASATAATEIRRLLDSWAQALGVTADPRGAIELACYEALANVACHAYAGRSVGVMELHATYDHTPPGPPRMTVAVIDHGRWLRPAPDPGELRGRGVPMIRSLSGSADIVGSETGTIVRMSWDLSLPSAIAS